MDRTSCFLHNIQRTTIFFDVDQLSSQGLFFQLANKILLVLVHRRVALLLLKSSLITVGVDLVVDWSPVVALGLCLTVSLRLAASSRLGLDWLFLARQQGWLPAL